MLRFIWLAIVAFVVTIPLCTTCAVIAMFKSTSPWIDKVMRLWGWCLLAAAGVTLRCENLEVIDPDKRYILVGNHYSYLDIPCIFVAIRQPIRFFAKVSLFKVPIFGWALARTGFIPIDRKNRRTAVKSFDLAVERIRKGNTIMIFPEEGRTRERAMRPFQRGAFLLALRSERPIVPIAIDGTYDVFPATRWTVKPGVVTIKAGTPLPTANRTVRDKNDLLKESRAQIQMMLFGEPEPPREDRPEEES